MGLAAFPILRQSQGVRLSLFSMSLSFRVFLALFTIIGFTSCGITKGKESAVDAVKKFHAEFNDSKFKEIYAAASPTFQKATTEADFLKFVQAVRRKLGVYQSGTQNGWRTNATTMGTFVELVYNSQFEKGGGVERFIFVISDETATLHGWNINSQTLVTD
jgi:hypothetical protein